jgi:hypothetical protein
MTPSSQDGQEPPHGAIAPIEIPKWRLALRCLFLVAVPTLVLLYVAGILRGKFSRGRRLNTSDTILVMATGAAIFGALWPEILERLGKVKLGGVEFELQKLNEKQQKQEADLDDIRFVLTLLLPPYERKHLENLWAGTTQNYEGNHNLRTELRKLRTLQLIESTRPIQDIRDEVSVDLQDYVRLTGAGRRYLERLNRES